MSRFKLECGETEMNVPSVPDRTVSADTVFHSDHVVFQVGKRLFKVPRRKFEQESEIFRDMFALPTSGGSTEGSSDEHPLLLEGIAEHEFRALLQVMFRPYYGASEAEQKEPYLHEWTYVLKLTTMWRFATLRVVAIDNLKPLLQQGDPVQWLSLARQYDVRDWLLPALHALARRTQPLRLCEVESLGIETVVKMAEVRESYGVAYDDVYGGYRSGGSYGGYRQLVARESTDFEAEIRRLFKDELKA